MGRGSKRQRKNVARSSIKSKTNEREEETFREEDTDDEIDAFHKQRDVVPLDVNDGMSEDEDLEEPVLGFEGSDDDDTDDKRSDDGDDTDEDGDRIDSDTHPKGLAAKIVRQAKYLKQKFGGGDDEMDDQEEEEEGERKASWGRSKRSYYDGDNVDYEIQSSDEDLPKEEEAEVLRIQREKAKSLSMEDFGLEDPEQDESDTDAEDKTTQDVKKRKSKGVFELGALESVEEVKKDLSTLSKEEQMDVVSSSAPELLGLLSELNEASEQLKEVKAFLCKKGEERDDLDKSRKRYLEVKQILLLAYCQAISFYLLLKTEGHPVRDHPVIARLVEMKNMLEKMKQIDASIPSKVKNIVNNGTVNGFSNVSVGDKSLFDTKPDGIAEAKLVTGESKKQDSSKDDLSKGNHRRSADEKPKDIQMSLQSLEMLKLRANLEAKLKQKGLYNNLKTNLDKAVKHSLKPVNRSLETLDDFDDEVKQIRMGQPIKVSQLIATKISKPKFASGDDDLPKRDDIGERRRKHELRVLARTGTKSFDDDVDDEDVAYEDGKLKRKHGDIGAEVKEDKTAESEDEFYKEVKRQRIEKLAAKKQLYAKTPVIPSSVQDEADGKRHITYQMEKNRGLTRPRKKLVKNPRKKYKIKHQKAVIRRKGQVRDIRKPSGPYGGELSGINTGVSRSIRFKS
ncbi:something about silencing protein 10 [Ananas comosus]|uniref:Something about silencing protein 10 n=1 Tax=Ananas comosus TaxID=4615 RepID=A0A6P5FJ69_ANACO|nr:something about silencing protein 10 [Ananas comosus]